jgi:hypothetical protein
LGGKIEKASAAMGPALAMAGSPLDLPGIADQFLPHFWYNGGSLCSLEGSSPVTIPAEIYANLRKTLLSCWPFENTMQSAALFLDARLSPWRHGLPQAASRAAAVDGLINYLYDKRQAGSGRSALVLFLEVLAEVIDPGDSCMQQLQELARLLEAITPSPEPGAVAGDAGQPSRACLLRLLTMHFGEEDLRDLCFYLDGVDFDNLPGRGKAAKARELLLYLERRRQLRALLDVGRAVRPDVPWDECVRAG